jgi:hypothetical protein
VASAAAVIDVGERQDGRVLIEGPFELIGRYGLEPHFGPEPRQAFGSVNVGREIALLRQDGRPAGPGRRCGRKQLEQAYRRRIRDQKLVRLRSDDRCKLGGDALRPVDPPVLVPAGDEVLAPLAFNDVEEVRRCRLRQCAKRVAVEVDDAVRSNEALAHFTQRIGRIERPRFLKAHL